MGQYITFNHNGYRYSVNAELRLVMLHDPNVLGVIREGIEIPTKEYMEAFASEDVLFNEETVVQRLKRESKPFVKLLNYVDYWRRTDGKITIFAQAIYNQGNSLDSDDPVDLINYVWK